MKRLCIAVIFLMACAGAKPALKTKRISPPFLLGEEISKLAENNIFQITVSVYSQTDDGQTVINVNIGNAFLVDSGVVVSVNHLFVNLDNKQYEIHLRTPTRSIPAKLVLNDVSNDVAILEAAVSGIPFSVRDIKDDDHVLYILGILPYGLDDEIKGTAYVHKLEVFKDGGAAGKNIIPTLGIVSKGMSGSAVLGADGKVVGVFSVLVGAVPISSLGGLGGAVRGKYILENLEFYRTKIKKINTPKSTDKK